MEQNRPIWNASLYKDEVQVEIWLNSQMERKILKFSKYEKHFTPKGKFQPSITISCLHAFAHIVSGCLVITFSPPPLFSSQKPLNWLKCPLLGRLPWALPTSTQPLTDLTAPPVFMEIFLQSYYCIDQRVIMHTCSSTPFRLHAH